MSSNDAEAHVGFWKRLFGSGANVIDHPVLGRISKDSGFWTVAEVESLGSRCKPSLLITGDEGGPKPECLSTYQRLREDWERIKPYVAEEIFNLNQNYFSEKPSRALKSLVDVWEAAELLAISVDADGDFSLTYRFDWQARADGHEITFYFENWVPAGSSIDG